MNPTLFINDLDRIDSAILGPTGIEGCSYYVDVQVNGPLDSNGFIKDFSYLKSDCKKLIKNTLDHVLIVPLQMPGIEWHTNSENNRTSLSYGGWSFHGPREAVFAVDAAVITVGDLAEILARLALAQLAPAITRVKFELRPESVDPEATFYRYTHGISGHTGNCQRLYHGHRSQLQIMLDHIKRPDLEKRFLFDVVGNSFHVLSRNQIERQDQTSYFVRYSGSQGEFCGQVPVARTHVIDGETSIETISQEFFKDLCKWLTKEGISYQSLSMACFEGIDKGAMVQTPT